MKHFDVTEFDCPCCSGNAMTGEVLDGIDLARSLAGVPFVINSGYRCETHNAKVGGSPTSSHMNGTAVDIKCLNSGDRFRILRGLIDAGFNRIGISKTFIHADMDTSKQYDVAWLY